MLNSLALCEPPQGCPGGVVGNYSAPRPPFDVISPCFEYFLPARSSVAWGQFRRHNVQRVFAGGCYLHCIDGTTGLTCVLQVQALYDRLLEPFGCPAPLRFVMRPNVGSPDMQKSSEGRENSLGAPLGEHPT